MAATHRPGALGGARRARRAAFDAALAELVAAARLHRCVPGSAGGCPGCGRAELSRRPCARAPAARAGRDARVGASAADVWLRHADSTAASTCGSWGRPGLSANAPVRRWPKRSTPVRGSCGPESGVGSGWPVQQPAHEPRWPCCACSPRAVLLVGAAVGVDPALALLLLAGRHRQPRPRAGPGRRCLVVESADPRSRGMTLLVLPSGRAGHRPVAVRRLPAAPRTAQERPAGSRAGGPTAVASLAALGLATATDAAERPARPRGHDEVADALVLIAWPCEPGSPDRGPAPRADGADRRVRGELAPSWRPCGGGGRPTRRGPTPGRAGGRPRMATHLSEQTGAAPAALSRAAGRLREERERSASGPRLRGPACCSCCRWGWASSGLRLHRGGPRRLTWPPGSCPEGRDLPVRVGLPGLRAARWVRVHRRGCSRPASCRARRR